MLIGKYKHNVDAKGRMIIPVKYRPDLGDDFIITRGMDGCLFLFSAENFKLMCERLSTNVVSDTNGRNFVRYFLANSEELSLDDQGRVVIPPKLREFAGIKGPTYIVGVDKRVEIWNAARWEELDDSVGEDDIEDIFEKSGLIL